MHLTHLTNEYDPQWGLGLPGNSTRFTSPDWPLLPSSMVVLSHPHLGRFSKEVTLRWWWVNPHMMFRQFPGVVKFLPWSWLNCRSTSPRSSWTMPLGKPSRASNEWRWILEAVKPGGNVKLARYVLIKIDRQTGYKPKNECSVSSLAHQQQPRWSNGQETRSTRNHQASTNMRMKPWLKWTRWMFCDPARTGHLPVHVYYLCR